MKVIGGRSAGRSTDPPRKEVSPASAGETPARILISVDLPAPFWPSRAGTSPGWRSKSTASSAKVAVNRLLRPDTARIGAAVCRLGAGLAIGVGSPAWNRAAAGDPGRSVVGVTLLHAPDLEVVLLVVVARDEGVLVAALG